MATMGAPATLSSSFQGTAQAFQQSLGTVPLLILAALVVVYLILGTLYESYIHPLTIDVGVCTEDLQRRWGSALATIAISAAMHCMPVSGRDIVGDRLPRAMSHRAPQRSTRRRTSSLILKSAAPRLLQKSVRTAIALADGNSVHLPC